MLVEKECLSQEFNAILKNKLLRWIIWKLKGYFRKKNLDFKMRVLAFEKHLLYIVFILNDGNPWFNIMQHTRLSYDFDWKTSSSFFRAVLESRDSTWRSFLFFKLAHLTNLFQKII